MEQLPKPTEAEPSSPIIVPGQDELPKEKKRFKVGLVFCVSECRIIMAEDAQTAVKLAEEGGGLPAGGDTPVLLSVGAYEMKEDTKPKSFVEMFVANFQHMINRLTNKPPTTPGGLIVPKFVPPKDIIKGG